MDSPFSLKNKTILVTGASSGIGRACAIECAKFGSKVIVTARDAKRLAETLSQLSGEGRLEETQQTIRTALTSCPRSGSSSPQKLQGTDPNAPAFGAISIIADISDDAGIEKVVEGIPEPLDGIVHSAGICKLRPFTFAARKHFEETLRINTLAPLELTHMLLKKNFVKDGASIVFISSIAGARIVATGEATYAASKAALCGAAKAMALELAPKKIRVNCVCPGPIETPMLDGLNSEERATNLKKFPLARFGTPEEVAYAAIYFLSDAATWTTGSELVVDGGHTIL